MRCNDIDDGVRESRIENNRIVSLDDSLMG